jgi:hypothetical protein
VSGKVALILASAEGVSCLGSSFRAFVGIMVWVSCSLYSEAKLIGCERCGPGEKMKSLWGDR